MRDIFRNPFCREVINPNWLKRAVVSRVQTIYDARSSDRMPELADALNEAWMYEYWRAETLP